jgi:hypothetical protein
MSNKTIFKRIALVAVTALGAGVLSVAPANAADNKAVTAVVNANTIASVLNIATVASITGTAAVTDVAQVSDTSVGNTSVGLLANSTTQTTSSLTSTATMRSDGEIAFYTLGVADQATTFIVDNGTISQYAATTGGFENLSSDRSTLVSVKVVVGTGIAIAVKPKTGATSMTVSMYSGGALSTATAAKVAAIQSGATSKGTLVQRYLVTVATTSVSGAYSAADSYIAGASAAADDTTATSDATNSLSISSQADARAYININLNDAYGVALGGKGALIISGTNGAGIGYDAGGAATSAASSFNLTQVSSTSSAGAITVLKPTARANKSFSTTVSISWNGVVVGTKSVVFKGEVATVTASSPKIGALNASNAEAFRVAYADDAGNAIYPTITDTSVVSATTTDAVTGASVATIGDSTSLAKGTLLCAAGTGGSLVLGGGKANLQLQHVNPLSGTVVKSNVWEATCQGDAYTYTAAWDKAVYTPGSVATLTIAFKDRDGDAANAYDLVGNGALITVAGGPSATAVTIPAATDKPDSAAGTKTYQFVVGTTEGDFAAVVTVADVNANTVAKAQTASYSVKSSSSTVTNADVLKSIVALIASINKQIQALQKLILARR